MAFNGTVNMIASNEIQTVKSQIPNGSNEIQGRAHAYTHKTVSKTKLKPKSILLMVQSLKLATTAPIFEIPNVVICYGYYGWPKTTLCCILDILTKTWEHWFAVRLFFGYFFRWIYFGIICYERFPKDQQGLACSNYILPNSKQVRREKKKKKRFKFIFSMTSAASISFMHVEKMHLFMNLISFTASLLPTYITTVLLNLQIQCLPTLMHNIYIGRNVTWNTHLQTFNAALFCSFIFYESL